MKLRKRITDVFLDRKHKETVPTDIEKPEEPDDVDRAVAPIDPEQPNQAARYGVGIDSMLPQNAERYWRVRRVRHLTPEENAGRHHIFVQAHFVEASTEPEARILIKWEDGSQELTIRKKQREPILSFAMFTWQTCSVTIMGTSSEVVTGLTANHPDELGEDGSRTGNTLFHHSFLVEFEEVVAVQNKSQIFGQVANGAGLRLQLLADGKVLGEGDIPQSGAFRFNSVVAGSYMVQVLDPATSQVHAQSAGIELDGTDTAEVNLEVVLPVEEPPAAAIQDQESIAPPSPDIPPAASQPSMPAEKTAVPDDPLPQPETGAGHQSVPEAETRTEPPVTPQGGSRAIEHYVLFGPRDHFATKVYLPLLMNRLLEANVTFGFNPDEAFHAKRITILASPDVLPTALDESFQQQGIVVQRVHGNLEQIKTAIGIQ